jgi:16S rRNA processing protein RimM
MTRVRIGRIHKVHGVRGEVNAELSLTPAELLAMKHVSWRGADGGEVDLTVQSARPALDRVLVKFEGFDDVDRVRPFTRGELYADAGQLPEPEPGLAYAFQLIGHAVRTEDGRELGTLADIVETGANPIYVVRGERERLLPAPPEFVKSVDHDAKVITLALPPGFEEL